MTDNAPDGDSSAVFCWLRLRRHNWKPTGIFQLGGPFNRGWMSRCETCGHTTFRRAES